MKIELTPEQVSIIAQRASQLFEDPQERLARLVEDMIQREGQEMEFRKSTMNMDGSYALTRQEVHGRSVGFTFGSGEGQEVDDARAALLEELEREGLDVQVRAEAFPVGRSAAGFAILVEAAIDLGKLAATVAAVDAAQVAIRKLIRAIRSASARQRIATYNVEFLKLICVDDALTRTTGGPLKMYRKSPSLTARGRRGTAGSGGSTTRTGLVALVSGRPCFTRRRARRPAAEARPARSPVRTG